MMSSDRNRRKCFTFIWKLENASYCWYKKGKSISSPAFIVDEIEQSKWKLMLQIGSGIKESVVELCLLRVADSNTENVEVDSEIAFLLNGTVLHSDSCTKRIFGQESDIFLCSAERDAVFPERRSWFNFRDTFTARCKIWKNVGEISKDVQCIARTRMSVQKRSFIWEIKNFSALESQKVYAYPIKSWKDNKKVMSLELSITANQKIALSISPEDQEIKVFMVNISVIDAHGNTIEGLKDEIWHYAPDQIKQHSLFMRKKKLMENKSIYLPNDVLSLKCECAISFGITSEEIEEIISDPAAFGNDEMDNCCPDKEGIVSVSKEVLKESLKSLLNNENESPLFQTLVDNLQLLVSYGSLSDIKLKTKNQTYFAHMFILSERCPVFKNMFSGEMRQRINDFVEIKDLDDDTFSRILQYIYKSKVEQLQWSVATKLYVGADIYKIIGLKKACSDYLKTNLSLTNVYEALKLVQLTKDEDLKDYVQRFICKNPKRIMGTEEWINLRDTDPELYRLTWDIMHHKIVYKLYETAAGKQEELSGSQNTPKKRKRDEEVKNNNSLITNFYKKTENTRSNAVGTNCPSTSQMPLDLPSTSSESVGSSTSQIPLDLPSTLSDPVGSSTSQIPLDLPSKSSEPVEASEEIMIADEDLENDSGRC